MIIKGKWKLAGGHVHIRVFVGKAMDQTFAKSGDLCVQEDEFKRFRDISSGWLWEHDQ